MLHRPSSKLPTIRSRRWMFVVPQVVLLAVAITSTAAANGPTVTFEPGGVLGAGAQTITVTGQGFDPTSSNGNGIYLVFGPITPAPGYYMDPSVYGQGLKWVHPGAQATLAEAPLGADGSFTTNLDIQSSFDNASGHVDCSMVACALITFGAHGSPDRSQDTCTLVAFATDTRGAGASASLLASTPPVVPSAEASIVIDPSGSPIPSSADGMTDPCSMITAAP